MKQKTVADLYYELQKLMKAGCGDKKVLISDDDDGTYYHQLHYSVISNPDYIKELFSSNPLGVTGNAPEDVVIVG